MKTFEKVMKNRIENWEYILKNDPNGEISDTKLVRDSLEEDKSIVRDMGDELARTRKGFDLVEFFRACGLIQG
jgi:hypothetical protein